MISSLWLWVWGVFNTTHLHLVLRLISSPPLTAAHPLPPFQYETVKMTFVPQEEFCYPVECLALTVEEVMHIRQVLVKAELEKFQQYKDVYTALKKGKVDGGGGLGLFTGTCCI